MNDSYRAVVREEFFIGGALVESRLSHGEAVWGPDRPAGREILATDRVRDPKLVAACDNEIESARAIARRLTDAKVRIVVRAATDADVESIVTIRIGEHSIATTREHAEKDYEFLARIAVEDRQWDRQDCLSSTLLWRNGTAAVLLHEAVGHAAEHGHAPLSLPPWLTVKAPLALRRESFRDVPLRRMTDVVVTQSHAPYDEPVDATEILLVSGGAYEPLTELVTIDVAIAERNGKRIAPFTVRAARSAVAASIAGARGETVRYPGVICSREGQELFVGSSAPDLITKGLR